MPTIRERIEERQARAAAKDQEARAKRIEEDLARVAAKPQVVFTKSVGEELTLLPEDAPAAIDAQAFRAFQLGEVEHSPEKAVEVGLPHPDSQTAHESQEELAPVTELVFTNDTNALPKGAAGGMIADGVFEIVKGTDNTDAEPDTKSTPRSPKEVDAVERFGSHPFRLEDDTHTNRT